MSFLFGGSPRYDYRPVGGADLDKPIGELENFNPWGYKQGLGIAGRQARQTLKDYFSGNVAYDQMGINKAPLAALKAESAGEFAKNSRALASGDAALGNSGLLQARQAALMRQQAQDEGQSAAGIVAGGYDKAANMYQQAKEHQDNSGLQAAGLKLGADKAWFDAQRGRYMPPTSYSGGFLDKLKQLGGAAAGIAGLPGEASSAYLGFSGI